MVNFHLGPQSKGFYTATMAKHIVITFKVLEGQPFLNKLFEAYRISESLVDLKHTTAIP
jgi:hypothetical protein